ncbi:MAG TPA: type II secretion system protein N [Casimicrobiaceae bacterium]|nr:type II secretion system protein N [Casimicrobiaceae bacterium]
MRVLAGLATFVAGAVLACVVAYWGWQIFGPRSTSLPPPPPASDPASSIIAANLFGATARAADAPTGSDSTLDADTRLLGILAEPGQRGHALFRSRSGAKLVARGEEIAPGVTLAAIDAGVVTIRDGAGEHRLVLRAPTGGGRPAVNAPSPRNDAPPSSVSSSAPRTASAARANATCAPPAGFGGTVVRLNTELMSGIGTDATQWNAVLAPVAGGLVVRQDNGFGAMLGLRAGDRITQANGIALSAPEDVGAAIVRPLVANQGVRLIGSRDGTTQELWLANVACAG